MLLDEAGLAEMGGRARSAGAAGCAGRIGEMVGGAGGSCGGERWMTGWQEAFR